MSIKGYEDIFGEKYHTQSGQCSECGCFLSFSGAHLAHRLEKSKANIKRYGLDIIDHKDNLALTCPSCNSSVLIGKGRVLKIKKHVDAIKKQLTCV